MAAPEPTPARIAIYVVAVDAVRSLAGVLDRIPESVRERVEEIFVLDAGSTDDTYLVGVGYKAVSGFENLTIMRGTRGSLGANNKHAFDYCRERGFDIVALLHADGKYAPEVLESLLEPVERGEVDAVFGSRLLEGRPTGRGMPLHKYIAIRLLSSLQNRLLGLGLSEYQCGYRAYRVSAIADLPYHANSDGLHFDTEIIVQMKLKGQRILEVAVPVYSGEEADSVRGVRYALNVLRVLGQYWLHTKGIREAEKYSVTEKYVYRTTPDASHQKILSLIEKDRQHILDLGCGAGYLAEALQVRGNTVVGADARKVPGVEERMSQFLHVDLDREPIPWTGPPFQYMVMADVLEHLAEPELLLAECRKHLAEDGHLIVSVPNVAHWSVRLPLLFGRFQYTARGILDRSHLRFYTLSSIRAELERAGFEVQRVETTVPPLAELLPEGRLTGFAGRLLTRLQILGNRMLPQLFSYQIVLRTRPKRP
ncbi:MAG: bifunctional glycosyltransferase/class I SAM-dependent methyltransferase [Proteobacteria bacterium]|nr:bifunctional glycosyltransferase/class I SAM-dependent methyltransferase [Pseudomonadota bacterium]